MDVLDRVQRPRSEWQKESRCNELTVKQAEKIFWNLPKGRPGKNPPHKVYCLGCPVMMECLNFGIVHKEHGVWGGSTRTQREKLPRPIVQGLEQKARQEGWFEGYSFDLIPDPEKQNPQYMQTDDWQEAPDLLQLEHPKDLLPLPPPVILDPFQQECLELFGWY